MVYHQSSEKKQPGAFWCTAAFSFINLYPVFQNPRFFRLGSNWSWWNCRQCEGWIESDTWAAKKKRRFCRQEFQVPKMEVLNLIRPFWGWVFPYISLTYSLCRSGFLHFRYLKCLVILFHVPKKTSRNQTSWDLVVWMLCLTGVFKDLGFGGGVWMSKGVYGAAWIRYIYTRFGFFHVANPNSIWEAKTYQRFGP